MYIYNTLTHKKEIFVPLKDKNVRMYVCGITPYDTTHLGHAFTYIFFDTLLRYLQFKDYHVTYTQNVTDINDRDNDILKRAQEQNLSWNKLASYWTNRFLSDMQSLNWTKPTSYLFASEQISYMIKLIEQILENGLGYKTNSGVYLHIEKIPDFGKLSRLNREEMILKAQEFEEDLNNPDKKNRLDITLWKPKLPDEPAHIPSFKSPWGAGRPGWHIECSAMSIFSLAEQIDIHGGGIDLIYPHHEAEIAQSEAATGKKPFAKYWLHTGTVMYKGQKMSKSLGNLVLISDILKQYSANTIRWVLLSHHWQRAWEFEEKELDEAESKVSLIKQAVSSSSANINKKSLSVIARRNDEAISQQFNNLTMKQFQKIMNNNLDTPRALKYLYSLLQTKNIQEVQKCLEVLGFKL